jgi:small-conductance mechanosensitive channel
MERRARTIIGVIEGTAGAVVVLIALIIVLHSLGVNVAAIVTGLGIGVWR